MFSILLLKADCCCLFLTSLWTTGCDSRTANGGDKSSHSIYIPWIQHAGIRYSMSVMPILCGSKWLKYKQVWKEMLVCKFLFFCNYYSFFLKWVCPLGTSCMSVQLTKQKISWFLCNIILSYTLYFSYWGWVLCQLPCDTQMTHIKN